MEDSGNQKEPQKIQQESDEVYSFIEKVFTRPLIKRTLQEIHDLEVLNQKNREYTLKKQEIDIKKAEQRKSLNKEYVNTEVRSRLSDLIAGYTTEKEKIQIENEGTVENDRIHVPVHLAIN